MTAMVSGVVLKINSGGGRSPVWWVWPPSCARSEGPSRCGATLGSVGSIGVVYERQSTAKADELAGGKRTLVRFPERKAGAWDGADLDEAARGRIEAMATLADNAFVSDVTKGRGVSVETVRSEEWGRGAILDAAEGVRVGLVDGVQGFDETISQLARSIRSGKAVEGGRSPTPASAGQAAHQPTSAPVHTRFLLQRLV